MGAHPGKFALLAAATAQKDISKNIEAPDRLTASAPESRPLMVYKVPIYPGVKVNKASRYIEGLALEMLEKLSEVHSVHPIPGDDAKLSRTKAQVPLFGVGVIRDDLPQGGSMANSAALKGVQMVVLDVDDATPAQIEKFDSALDARGWLYLKAPTFNHKPEQPRVRYVLPLSRVAEGGDYYKLQLFAGLQRLSGGICDKNAMDATRRSYLPSCLYGGEHTRPAPVIKGTQAVDPEELAALTPEQPLAVMPLRKYDMGVNADVLDARPKLEDKRDRDPGLIAAGCGMFDKYLQTGDPGGEALWRYCGGILKFCQNGKKLYHDVSAKDKQYTERETDKKLDGWTLPPPTCAGIEGAGWDCNTCPNKGRITSPVQLGDSLDTEKQPSALTALAGLVESGALLAEMDQNGAVNYIKAYERNGRQCRSVHRAGTEAAEDVLIAAAMAAGRKIPSPQLMATFEGVLRVKAKESGEVTPTALRAAKRDGVAFQDLGPGRIARIAPATDGTAWSVIEETKDAPIFRRGAGAGELPNPEFTGTPTQALQVLLSQYKNLFGLDGRRALVAVVLLLDALDCDSAHPVREYVGPGGSGKSTMAEHDVDLIDPSDSGRRTTGLKVEDLAAATQQNYAVMADNAGRLEKVIQDALCITSTGGTLMVRRLYEQGETMPLRMHNPMFITAISPVCTQADLLTRDVRFEMAARQKDSYVPEDEMRAQMRASRPQMLGAMYTLLSAAMAALPTVRQRKQWPHRMVSFDQLGEAVVLAAGVKPGTFLTVIGEMRERMARRTASGDPFVIHLLAALRKFAAVPTDSTQAALGAILKRKVPLSVVAYDTDRVELTARPGALRDTMPRPTGFERDNAMPGSDRAFLDALRRVQPMLASMGIDYRERMHGSRPFVEFDTCREALNAD